MQMRNGGDEGWGCLVFFAVIGAASSAFWAYRAAIALAAWIS